MLTQHDHDMIHHAKQRKAVRVRRNGQDRLATLVAWKPFDRNAAPGKERRRKGNVARVQFSTDSASRLTVKCSEVEAIDLQPAQPNKEK